MPGLREKKKKETRKAILDAAIRIFAEKGYDKTSIEEIAREAGVGKSTIYGYFQAKNEIVLAFLKDDLDYSFKLFAEENDTQASPLEQLVTLFKCHFRYIARNREFGRFYVRELTFPREPLVNQCVELESRYFKTMETILEPARARGELRPDLDTRFATGHFYALYLMVISAWYKGYISTESEAEEGLRLFFRQALEGMGICGNME